jgi:hypothetical protein
MPNKQHDFWEQAVVLNSPSLKDETVTMYTWQRKHRAVCCNNVTAPDPSPSFFYRRRVVGQRAGKRSVVGSAAPACVSAPTAAASPTSPARGDPREKE